MADVGNALNQGEQFARGLAADERKAHAYNALAQTYGVALAGDPDTAIKDQEYTQREITNPIAVQQAQATLEGTGLDNASKTETNAFNVKANPLRLTGLSDTNANTEATTANTKATTNRTNRLLPGEVAQQGATLAQTNANTGYLGAETAHTNVETKTGQLALNTAEAAQQRQSAMGILASLSDVASNGGDVGAAFDKLAPLIAKFEGTDAAHMAPLREQLVKDPVNTINRLSTGLQQAQMAAMGGKASATGALQLMKFQGQQMALKDGLNFTAQRTAAVPGIADQMTDLVPQLSTVATIRAVKAKIPGTPEYQFHQLAEQLRSNASLDDLRNLKSTGLSMGRVTNMEMGMTGNAIVNTDLGQPTSTLAANLKRVKALYGTVNDNLQKDIARIGTGSGGMGPRATAPTAAPQFKAGVVYTDAAGNKATTSDGGKTWAPVQ